VHEENWDGCLVAQSNELDRLFGFVGEYYGVLIRHDSYMMTFNKTLHEKDLLTMNVSPSSNETHAIERFKLIKSRSIDNP